MEIVLKENVIKSIEKNNKLLAELADHLGFTMRSFIVILKNNDPRLTQAGSLKIIKTHLGLRKDSELLEEKVVAA
jgi:hypothetical protein